MKREIKFRVWDTKADNPQRKGLKGVMVCWDYFENHFKAFYYCLKNNGNDVFLMQFTGLLDKNGKEIYEGDIVQFNFGIESKEGVINTKVIFYDGCFMYESHTSYQVKRGAKWDQQHNYCDSRWWGPGCYPLCGGFYGKGDLNGVDNSTSKIEVVGNIYENPELLQP